MNTANNSNESQRQSDAPRLIVVDGRIDWIECPVCGCRIDGIGICFSCGNTKLPDIKISPSGADQTGVFFKGLDNE